MMMPAPLPPRRSRRRASQPLLLVVSLAVATACSSGQSGMSRDPLESLPMRATPVPDEPDHAARKLATAALAGEPGEARAQQKQLEAVERMRRIAGDPPSGLPA
jgi:hypothetical protein